LDDIRKHNWILTPGRYVGASEIEDDAGLFEVKMTRLAADFHTQTKESARLEKQIAANLKELGYAK
jgi:type I restriction enzyme M protein